MGAVAAGVMGLLGLLGIAAFVPKGQPLPAPDITDVLEKMKGKPKEKEKKPDKDPNKDPKPVPVPPPNTTIQEHKDKEKKKDCEERLKPYRIGRHGDVRKTSGINEDSHHIFQNAFLQRNDERGQPSKICPNYTEDDGIAIPLDKYIDHAGMRAHQEGFSKGIKAVKAADPSYRFTYDKTKNEMRSELAEIKLPKPMDARDIECVIDLIDDMMKRLCPDLFSGKTELRIPGTRDK